MIKKLTLIGLALLISGGAFADGKSLTRYVTGSDVTLATGVFQVKMVAIIPTSGTWELKLYDAVSVTGTPKFHVKSKWLTEVGVVVPQYYQIGDNDDFLAFYTGMEADITNCTAEVYVIGNGRTTLQNDNSATVILYDPVLGTRYDVVASGTASLRDAFAIWVLQNKSNWSVP